ncbi:MAG: hypothetical protein EA428_08290 [Spirochaetaceae bacterium]|nr:MAG: hypothetical protein EA428_08290 [Spirochaetaceae bacterium]
MSRARRELLRARAAVLQAHFGAGLWQLGWSTRNLSVLVLLGVRYCWALRLPLRERRSGPGLRELRGQAHAARQFLQVLWAALVRPAELPLPGPPPGQPQPPGTQLAQPPARQLPLAQTPAAQSLVGGLPGLRPGAATRQPGWLLQDARVRRFQGKALSLICRRYLGVRVRPVDRAVLGAYASVDWVLQNVYTAAGVTADGRDAQRRCAVVFPTVVRLLSVQQSYAGCSPEQRRMSLPARLRFGALRRRYGVGPGGEITGSLYPQAVEVERYRRRAELCGVNARRRRKAGALAAELARLSVYDIALSLFLTLGSREAGRELILRRHKLTRLERVHCGAFSVSKNCGLGMQEQSGMYRHSTQLAPGGEGGQDGRLDREERGIA